MMTSLLPPKRYMATIALRAPGCGEPSRHRWHTSHPSWVGLRREGGGGGGGEGEGEGEGGVVARSVQPSSIPEVLPVVLHLTEPVEVTV